MTTSEPKSKARQLMSDCTQKIDDYITIVLSDAISQMPDIDENNAIFIDSVLAGTIIQVLINRSSLMDTNEKRKYIRTILAHVKEVANKYITDDELKGINDNTE